MNEKRPARTATVWWQGTDGVSGMQRKWERALVTETTF